MHEGHRERMRERYLKNGISGLAPHEVLELLLFYTQPRVDTNATAHKLLDTFGSLSGVLDADVAHICSVPGVGKSSALFFHLLRDCITLYTQNQWAKRPRLITLDEVGSYVLDMIVEKNTEGFYILCLDPSHYVTGFSKLESGSAYKTSVDVRKVVESALMHRAFKVILVHNHPSGSLQPSESDIRLTKKLTHALREIEIPVIDHIIAGNNSYFSMAEHNLL